jgi:hypothetical protein
MDVIVLTDGWEGVWRKVDRDVNGIPMWSSGAIMKGKEMDIDLSIYIDATECLQQQQGDV